MNSSRLYLDSEFTELSKNGKLISFAVVSENDHVFYAEFNDISHKDCSQWIKENVLSNLLYRDVKTNFSGDDINVYIKNGKIKIIEAFNDWLSHFGKVKIFADCLAYDWVLFCDLFGTAFDIPKQIFYMPFDLATLLLYKGFDPDINRESFVRTNMGDDVFQVIKEKGIAPHNSLFDAMIIKYAFEILELMPWEEKI